MICLASTALAACNTEDEKEAPETPRIIEIFACSDNCPGPREQYMKRIYEGVEDEEECRKLGGRLFTIVGWGKRVVCEVPVGGEKRVPQRRDSLDL